MDIDQLQPGSEFDRLIDTKVFKREIPTEDQMVKVASKGWITTPKMIHFEELGGFSAQLREDGTIECHARIPLYSQDPAEAWRIVLRFLGKGFQVNVESVPTNTGWRHEVAIRAPGKDNWARAIGMNLREEQDTFPLAVCRAALKAVGA